MDITSPSDGSDVQSGDTITLSADGDDSDCYYSTSADGCFICSDSRNDDVSIVWGAVYMGTSAPAGTFPNGNTGSSVQWKAPLVCSDENVVIFVNADDSQTTKYDDAPDSDSVELTIKPRTAGYWADFDPGFGCPALLDPYCLLDQEKTKQDGCGNTLTITCNDNIEYCRYNYIYNSTLVGKCVWEGAHNIFQYKISADNQRFLETKHATCNLDKGIDSQDEGCEGYYCYRTTEYNCINGNPPMIYWIRDDSSTCTCLIGYPAPNYYESCPGPSGGGIHRDYPD